MSSSLSNPIKTALFDLHTAQGGRMVDFAGYFLPVQFKGLIDEHNHTRNSASLFDVSHMGQVSVSGADFATASMALETLLPGNLQNLKPGGMRYTVLLNDAGGIEDDLIVTRSDEGGRAQAQGICLSIVVNAARKTHDMELFKAALGDRLEFELHEDKSLLALQGPLAAKILANFTDAPHKLAFMQTTSSEIGSIECQISRCGYTGEDGFEISVANSSAAELAKTLYGDERVLPAGLGARDSLRLEAGLCLYGHDMNDEIDPVSANIIFAVGKKRRETGGFTGADAVISALKNGPKMLRVGVVFDGRMPVREGADIVDEADNKIGSITSGTFSPSLGSPIAMGYVPASMSESGTAITAIVRGRKISGTVSDMPFVKQNYARQPGV
ncbi:MAG: glycine cleavage system aminomethyltransferase GcvT [Devosiaceae bacterium]|nr:glycine cleavage system aminomethyltransferase GcvT [Devosiaceae bacterium]